MLKVLSVVDKEKTAIDRLAQGIKPYMNGIQYDVVSVHPKRPDAQQLADFNELAQQADIIDFQYWRTALTLLEIYPWLETKKKMLAHYNPYSITESDWKQFDIVTACNQSIAKDLPGSKYVPLTVDTEFWTFNQDWKPTKNVIMVANRIESKKGILEVAIACGELNLNFILVGAISDRDYFNAVMATGVVDFYEQITDEQLRDLYHKSSLHVCNSADNFESGTLPILEAMLCGVPVLTRNIGHVPDLNDGENMVIYEGDRESVLEMKDAIVDIFNDKKKMASLRENGWKTAKNRSNERRAYDYMRMYRSFNKDEAVSVIVPIYNKPEIIRQCLNAIAEQDYDNIEIIVCDDFSGETIAETISHYEDIAIGKKSDNEKLIDDFAKTVNIPVKYIYTANGNDYGLARARNLGAIEATSDILLFCDQRMIMQPGAIREFVSNLTKHAWLYGNKGARKEFVENFSCVYRQDFFDCGGFNERINLYGGMSQEIRSRIRAQGFGTPYVEGAKAIPTGNSRNKYTKKNEIIKMKNLLYKIGLQ